MILTSSAFSAGESIPETYTCDGRNISPPLAWSGVPPGAQSLVLIVDDPDAPDPAAPKKTWVHWLLYNVPSSATGLSEGIVSTGLPSGTKEGVNDFKRGTYGGPCPPIGRHRYFHKLFALDIALSDLFHPDKAALEAAMHGHILAEAQLVGTYQRSVPSSN